MIRPISDAADHPTPEDWRILRALSFYRLLLVTLQLVLHQSGYLGRIFNEFHAKQFYATCVVYAVLSLLLLLLIVYRKPRAEAQAHIHFFVDAAAILALAYACGGVASGLGMLILTPAVGCSMVLTPRMALVQAAGATLATLGMEVYRQYPEYDTGPFTQAGILGLMFFVTSVAASFVAQRARQSEAKATQAGIDLESFAQLNESVIEHMQTGVAVIESSGNIRLLNAAAARMLEANPGESLPRCAPGLQRSLDEWRQGHAVMETPVASRPGTEEVIPRFRRLGWGEAAPTLVLLDNARALRDQALQMNLAALGRLSAGIAHEIRNPLSAIAHAGALLAESPGLTPENQKLLSMIQRHSERIDKIVKDVLALSRKSAPEPAPIRLRPWLETAVAQYREGHPEPPRAIRFDKVAPDFTLRFDESHLQQVLFNLWDNSFVHGARDGRPVEVEVTTGHEKGSGSWLEVRDNGPGIPTDLRDRVFEPFFSTSHKGTGLGLYLARELCEYNHSRLSYRHSGHGACFRLAFAAAE